MTIRKNLKRTRAHGDDGSYIEYDDGGFEEAWTEGAPPSKTRRQERLERELEQRRAAGEKLEPVMPNKQRDMAENFWAQAWNRHLMHYALHENRMPKGRTDFRAGRVMDLTSQAGEIAAVVAGAQLWSVRITVAPISPEAWEALRQSCLGKIGDVAELLTGELPEAVLKTITEPENGLFPTREEIRCLCPCEDHADLCQHSAALLYAWGSHLDERPEALFTLRGVQPADLVADLTSAIRDLTSPASSGHPDALHGVDLNALFGLEEPD
jgi:uncharacterized Zn finger protein